MMLPLSMYDDQVSTVLQICCVHNKRICFKNQSLNYEIILFIEQNKELALEFLFLMCYSFIALMQSFHFERVVVVMSTVTIVFAVLQLLSGLALTVIVLMQSGKSAGLSGAISGGAETFLSKGKAKTLDAKLAKATKWFALAFVVLTLVLNLVG